MRNSYWKRRFDDMPLASQINKGIPKRKVGIEEQKKIDEFVAKVGERALMLQKKQNKNRKNK